MRAHAICLWMLLLASAVCAAAGGLSPVAAKQGEILLGEPLTAIGGQLAKPPKGAGLVSPEALVATFPRKGGAMRVAIDATKAGQKTLDVVRIDFTGAGKFAADGIPLTGSGSVRAFGPQTVPAQIGGTAMQVTVWGAFQQSGTTRRLTFSAATAVQGSGMFAGKPHAVRIVDGDNNLHPGDAFPLLPANSVAHGDTILVDLDDGTFWRTARAFYGHPVLVDGKWYTVALAADGASVTVKPFTGKTTTVSIDSYAWKGIFAGKTCLLTLSGNAREFTVPADDYRVVFTDRSSGPSVQEYRRLAAGGRMTTIAAKAGARVKVALPAIASVLAEADGHDVSLALEITDATGIDRTPEDGPDTIEYVIVDARGNIVFEDTFEHG